jgi:hypothetical protein
MRELLAALSYDPTVDTTTGPRVRRRVTISMIAFMFIVLMGTKLLLLAGVGEFTASLATAFAYFAVFVFLSVLFRRSFKNPFHRGMLVYGLVFGGQIIGLRLTGLLLGLTYVQIVTLDLIALAAMSCVTAALVFPSLWPVVPLASISALIAVFYPQYAQPISSGVVVVTTVVALLLWNRAVGMRSFRRKSSTDRSREASQPGIK